MAQPMDASSYANLPLAAPPPGVVPNFNNPQSRAYQLHIGMAVCIGITSVFVLLRIYARAFVQRTWGWEDREYAQIAHAHC